MQIFNKNEQRKTITLLKEMPNIIVFNANEKSSAHFCDGSFASLGCLKCSNPKCMYFSNDEITCNELSDFPSDNDNSVCPVRAISWDVEKECPVFDSDKCIKCGICISRCPVGAIFYSNVIKVNTVDSSKQQTVPCSKCNLNEHLSQIEHLQNISKGGCFIKENDELLQDIYQKLFHLDHHFHNFVARNLLISLKCHCSIRRIGDVYTRMDGFYSSNDKYGALEVEFGRDTLDASRAILDDIAVLFTRYGIKKQDNLPLVVCLQLPNVRQGYWQVVKDVKTVEDIIINTVTIGSLILLNWNLCELAPEELIYYLDYDNMDLRSSISKKLGRDINISSKLLGIFEPNK